MSLINRGSLPLFTMIIEIKCENIPLPFTICVVTEQNVTIFWIECYYTTDVYLFD